MLHIKGFAVTKTEGDVVHFQQGAYDGATGQAVYTSKELPFVLQKCVGLHKTVSAKVTHWFALLFAAMLCFLAVSSFWMYPSGSGMVRRGICIAIGGLIVTIVVLAF